MQASELFKQSNTILLDGGMGTMLQASGLKLGAKPEELNITNPELIESIHAKYAAAGSRIVNANTFGASAHKLAGSAYSLEEIIAAGIANCKRACAPYGALTTLDVGPLGELLEPSGTLAFEDAVNEYARIVRAGVAAGADLIFFETFTDLYELKAALLAAKENSTLPILASMSFEAGGRTFTGCTVESFGVTARGLGANAVGINCSLGPKEIYPMAKRLAEAVPGDFPLFVKPNAGLPRADGSGYDITPQLFAMEMKPYRDLHLFAAGGCCGTTPDFIKLLNGVFAGCVPGRPAHKMPSVLCSPVDFVNVDGITVVGERINPTGKKRFQQALREGDMNYILEQAVSQVEAGAQVLDVNVGAPGVDEPAMMPKVVKASPACRCSWIPPMCRHWKTACGSTTASPSSTPPTASRKSWTPSCRCAKSTVRPSWALPSTSAASCLPPRTAWTSPAASPKQPSPPASRGRISTSTALP